MASVSDSGLHLLDINVRPCAYVKDVIQGSWNNLKEGVTKEGRGKKIHGFKVIGENRLVTVLDGAIESAVDTLNAAYGDQIEVKCTPLRTYEGFAEHVLGVDKSLTKVVSPRRLGTDGRLFWLVFRVGYRGLNAGDLIATWAREATAALTLRSRGDMEMDLFKVVAQREVHLFAKVPDAEIMDDICFTLPLIKELGDQVELTSKAIVHLDLTTA
jgi:hypothetical protein